MKFELKVNELDEQMGIKLPVIKELSDSINNYFSNGYYGSDLESIKIIIILIKTKQGYEEWYKIRKPKFIDNKIIENVHTGIKIEISKEFMIETRIDHKLYDTFLNSTTEEDQQILAVEILKALSNLDALPKKVKDFDKERFKADMEAFFREKGWID